MNYKALMVSAAMLVIPSMAHAATPYNFQPEWTAEQARYSEGDKIDWLVRRYMQTHNEQEIKGNADEFASQAGAIDLCGLKDKLPLTVKSIQRFYELSPAEGKTEMTKKAKEAKEPSLVKIFCSVVEREYEQNETGLNNVLVGKPFNSGTVLPEYEPDSDISLSVAKARQEYQEHEAACTKEGEYYHWNGRACVEQR
jgi:hypothetical protein